MTSVIIHPEDCTTSLEDDGIYANIKCIKVNDDGSEEERSKSQLLTSVKSSSYTTISELLDDAVQSYIQEIEGE